MRNDLLGIPIYQAVTSDLINLATNENFYSQWTDLINKDIKSLIDITSLHSYGTSEHLNLISSYAKYLDVQPNQILCAPGSDSLISLLINSLTFKNVLTLEPDFFRYSEVSTVLQRENIKVNIDGDVYDNIIKIVEEQQIELLIISNPNNPLGIIHKREDLVKVLDNTNCYVVIDEAYAEYQQATISDLISRYDNLIVLRTLSKAWGLANLRVGFVITNAKLILFLKAIQGPFVLNDISSEIAAIALKHKYTVQTLIEETIKQREVFIKFLSKFNFNKVYESSANFVYIDTDDALHIKEELLGHGIAVSYFKPSGIRITIGNKLQMTTLIKALKSILEGN